MFRGPRGPHYPLNQRTPPGIAAYWAGTLGRADRTAVQPVEVKLPSKGRVSFVGAGTGQVLSRTAPAKFKMGVGYTYRLEISGMPEFPGEKLYPSIEVIDRLHPPPALADKFSIPVEITREDIDYALEGRFVTKVIYLEQPQLASPLAAPVPVETVRPDTNAIAVADQRGRPVAILRLGGRRLLSPERSPGSYGPGGPISRRRNRAMNPVVRTSGRRISPMFR
ncbi:MAG: hypothetical protein Tsb009_22170 [Planctomycetaceae bacterium]